MNKKDLTTKVAKRKRVTFHQRNDTCLFYLSIADQSLGIGGRRCFILGGWGGGGGFFKTLWHRGVVF